MCSIFFTRLYLFNFVSYLIASWERARRSAREGHVCAQNSRLVSVTYTQRFSLMDPRKGNRNWSQSSKEVPSFEVEKLLTSSGV